MPDLLSRLTWAERKMTVVFFSARLRGKGRNESPDEAPASVARRAIVLGSYACFFYLAVYPCVAVILWSAVAGANLAVVFALIAGFFALGLALGGVRHRQINRYFAGRFPDTR